MFSVHRFEQIQLLALSAAANPVVADGLLACAESLLADGKKAEALATYKSLLAGKHPKHVKLAVTRGMLACAGK